MSVISISLGVAKYNFKWCSGDVSDRAVMCARARPHPDQARRLFGEERQQLAWRELPLEHWAREMVGLGHEVRLVRRGM